MAGYPDYETLLITTVAEHVLLCEINRPDKLNTMTPQFWTDVRNFFEAVELDETCRVVLIGGAGKMFTAGLDMASGGLGLPDVPVDGAASSASALDVARIALKIRREGKLWQQRY